MQKIRKFLKAIPEKTLNKQKNKPTDKLTWGHFIGAHSKGPITKQFDQIRPYLSKQKQPNRGALRNSCFEIFQKKFVEKQLRCSGILAKMPRYVR